MFKKIIFTSLFSLFAVVGLSQSVDASEVDHVHNNNENISSYNILMEFPGIDVADPSVPIEIEDITPSKITPRSGYRWYCQTSGCGYTSEWHMFYNTAAKYAQAHNMKYGHSTIVYGV